MPKKTEEKNVRGSKKVTKASSSKKNTSAKKTQKSTKVEKVVNTPEITIEEKNVTVVKKDNKKGNNGNSLTNNTPFVVSVCIIVLLVAVLIFVACTKRVPVTSKGEEIVATIDGKTITADELYLSLKDAGGKDQLLSIIDEYITDKEVTVTEDDEKYVKEVVDYYLEYAEYYDTDLATFLANYVGLSGINTEEEFSEFVLKDYKKTLAITNFISEKASDEDLKTYYKENYSDYLTVKHILIEIDKETEDADKADKDAYNKAVKLIKKLNDTNKKDLDKKFEELAEKNSDDTGTYSNGGLVENFKKSEVEKEFYNASYELKDGEYTKEPIKTTYGYHIILKVSSTEADKYEDVINEVKKGWAEKQLNEDSTLFTLKWGELRESYNLSIKDDFMKKAYEDSIKDTKNKKTED